jgi:hypothetical protein
MDDMDDLPPLEEFASPEEAAAAAAAAGAAPGTGAAKPASAPPASAGGGAAAPPLGDGADGDPNPKAAAANAVAKLLGKGASAAPAEPSAEAKRLMEREFLTDWGTPEQEQLQKQMIDAALAKQPEVTAEREAKEVAVTREFAKGTALKKGFLLGGGGGAKKKPAAAATPSSSSSSSTALVKAAAGSGSGGSGGGKADDVIRPTASRADALRLPEVQEALRANLPAMERKLANRSEWMTPELLERIARDPRLAAGMANPR